MSGQGIEPCPDCGGQGGTDGYDQSGEPTHSKATCQRCDGTGELATPPVPAGEVGELIKRLRRGLPDDPRMDSMTTMTHGCQYLRQAADLLERYAAENARLREKPHLKITPAPPIVFEE